MQSSSFANLSSQSPSFTAQSSEDLADIAARVVNELNLNNPFEDDDDVVYLKNDDDAESNRNDSEEEEEEDEDTDDEESEFEFAVFTSVEASSPISADEIFSNGIIKPMYYPVFGNDIMGNNNNVNDMIKKNFANHSHTTTTLRLPLRKLLSEERSKAEENNEAGGLEGVAPGTYCVWAPKKKGEAARDGHVMEKKSRSTGSCSRRWRFRDLLPRSNSDGKDTFVFLTPTNNGSENGNEGKRKVVSVGNGKRKGGERKSYLPYRQDLVGLFASVNGVSRTVRPF